jgi:hypothetical protein
MVVSRVAVTSDALVQLIAPLQHFRNLLLLFQPGRGARETKGVKNSKCGRKQ